MGKIRIVVMRSDRCDQIRQHNAEECLLKNKDVNDRQVQSDWRWPNEEEEVVTIDFSKVIRKIGIEDEFQIGYLTVEDNVGRNFYNNQEAQDVYQKYNPRIINKEDCQELIHAMRRKIVDRYYEILHEKQNWQGVLEHKMDTWGFSHDFPYNLDDPHKMVNVYEPEFQIWDLIRLYKNVDWIRDTVVLYHM